MNNHLLETDNIGVKPDFTILIPTCNEEKTIVKFISWCKEGINESGLSGEILIVDSSSDSTAQLAHQHGARVLITEKRGLGQAYRDGLLFVKSPILILGDADCTYDFRILSNFVNPILDGADFVMGSRWLGTIEKGSMPILHKYLGTPATTRLLNVLYGTKFSDIHCGMRAVSLKAINRMNLKSSSWEYASEMVLKSVLLDLNTLEVPVSFYKDQPGRVSHHKRDGWFSPFSAAIKNIKMMLTYRADSLAIAPGATLMFVGFTASFLVVSGEKSFFTMKLNLIALITAYFMAFTGGILLLFGFLAREIYKAKFSINSENKYKKFVNMFKTVCAVTSTIGVILLMRLVLFYFLNNATLPNTSNFIFRSGIGGIFLLCFSFIATLFLILNNYFLLESIKEEYE